MVLRVVEFVLAFFLALSIVTSQSIYIDRDPSYYALPCCAQIPLSIAVRDMSQGCGDNGHLTSYDCFCTTSYSYFNSLISTEILGQCSGNVTDVTDGISVFNNYCAVGASRGTQSTAIFTGPKVVCGSTSSALPAGIATNSLPTVTSIPTATAPPPANTSSSSALGKIRDLDRILMVFSFVLEVAFVW